MAAVQEISMYAAVAAVLSEVGDTLTFKVEQRTALKQFLNGKKCFFLAPKTNSTGSSICLNKTRFMDLLLEEYM